MDSSLRCLLWGILGLQEIRAGPGSHTLQYMHTGWTRPEVGEPQFVTVGYVDDVEFVRFDSDAPSPRVTPRVAWMERVAQEDPEYWERNTWIGKSNTRVYHAALDTMQGYRNQSQGGVHAIQFLHGCEVSPDGRLLRGISQYAYNGQDYNTWIAKTWTCVAAPQAEISKSLMDPERESGNRKAYLEVECVKWLLKYLEMGKEALTRTDPPSARVTHHTALDGRVTLRCQAQDFYPAEISLTWLRDGEEQLQDMEFIETRPGGDGTFQKWAAVEVTPGHEAKYTCRVQHQGLAEPLTLKWEPPSSFTWTILCVLLILLIVFTVVLAGVVIWRRNNSDGQTWRVSPGSRHPGDSGSPWPGENGGNYVQAPV